MSISFDAPSTLGSQKHEEIHESKFEDFSVEKASPIDMNNASEENIKLLEKALAGKQSVEITFESLESTDAETQGTTRFRFWFTMCGRRFVFSGCFRQQCIPFFRCNATLWFGTVAQLRGCHCIAGIVGPGRGVYIDISNGVTITGTTVNRAFCRGHPFTGRGCWTVSC
ncbi:hypothetical protein CVT24_004826 [Panaeolus cyanescens]|uniref:Uncharacterized protein n=1 Tax=Panaeolus cyanescens TaxID=181874 RepID=A0A409W1X8_9AGAR|nr:hypothetical protein CVT24_004826 [Panaeolus cyanescens]